MWTTVGIDRPSGPFLCGAQAVRQRASEALRDMAEMDLNMQFSCGLAVAVHACDDELSNPEAKAQAVAPIIVGQLH